MSRTHKDAPRKVRERRLGIIGLKDRKKNCPLCEAGSESTVTTGFSAIFFSHEVKEIRAFEELAETKGYTIQRRELQGYLGRASIAETFAPRFSSRKSDFDGLLDPKRAIYSAPRGVIDNLLWTSSGPRSDARDARFQNFRSLFSAERDFDRLFDVPEHVSQKRNIFTVVSIFQETAGGPSGYHYHSHDGMDYLLWSHCHCGRCQPEEKVLAARVRDLSNELRKAYNSGEREALEEIAAEIPRSSAGGYRDSSNC